MFNLQRSKSTSPIAGKFFYEKGRMQGKNRHYKDMSQLHTAVETGAHFI